MIQQIEQTILEKPIRGRNLPETTLGTFLDDQNITLLVFLRHFG